MRVIEIDRALRGGTLYAPRQVDYLKQFTQLRAPEFYKTIESDIESMFRQLDAVFSSGADPRRALGEACRDSTM